MTEFRYQAMHVTGEPVYGLREASSDAELTEQLASEGLLDIRIERLRTLAELVPAARSLPRLVQLRVGERLREAFLLQLPAHELLRAVADEPLQHPLLLLLPWLSICGVFAALAVWPLTTVIPLFPAWVFRTALFLSVLLVVVGIWSRDVLQRRPRQLLRRLADELERGQVDVGALQQYLPAELRELEMTGLDETQKTRLLGELIPDLGRMRLQRYRLAGVLLGPFPIGIVLTGGLAVLSGTLLRQIMVLLDGFGQAGLSSGVDIWLVAINLLACGILVGIFLVAVLIIFSGRCQRFGQRLPLIGRSLIWLSQSSFCRVLAAHLRQGGRASGMIRSAAAVTGGVELCREAAEVAASLEAGDVAAEPCGRWLGGVPLALLTTPGGQPLSPEESMQAAAAFDGMSGAFEAASTGDGGFAALIFGFVLVVFSGLLLAVMWLAVLLPLLQLLDDLALVLTPLVGPFAAGGMW